MAGSISARRAQQTYTVPKGYKPYNSRRSKPAGNGGLLAATDSKGTTITKGNGSVYHIGTGKKKSSEYLVSDVPKGGKVSKHNSHGSRKHKEYKEYKLHQEMELDDISETLERNSAKEDFIAKSIIDLDGNEDVLEIRDDKSVIDPAVAIEKKKLDLRKKYIINWNVPKTLLMPKLIAKVKPYLEIIPLIVAGKFPSRYGYLSKKLFNQSQYEVLTTHEMNNLNLDLFQAGYYGFKRQFLIGRMIYDKFYKKLLKKILSPHIQWWGALEFCKYVLAPELLLLVCVQEMHLKKENDTTHQENYATPSDELLDAMDEACHIFENTLDFGTQVADSDPLEEHEQMVEESRLKSLCLDPNQYGAQYAFEMIRKSDEYKVHRHNKHK